MEKNFLNSFNIENKKSDLTCLRLNERPNSLNHPDFAKSSFLSCKTNAGGDEPDRSTSVFIKRTIIFSFALFFIMEARTNILTQSG